MQSNQEGRTILGTCSKNLKEYRFEVFETSDHVPKILDYLEDEDELGSFNPPVI